MDRRRIGTLVLGAAFAVGACGGGTSTVGPGNSPAGTEAPVAACAPSAQSGSVQASIVDFEFMPATVDASVGAVITFTNGGSARHSATLDVGDCGTEVLSPGDTGALTFSSPGSYAFHCSIHPSMKGTIEVSG